MSRFGQTGMVVAKCDRAVDPYQHIDRTREEVYEHLLRLEVLEREMIAVKNSLRGELSDTGIWDVVKAKLDAKTVENAINWRTWAIRGVIGGLSGLLLWGIVDVVKLAWRGLYT